MPERDRKNRIQKTCPICQSNFYVSRKRNPKWQRKTCGNPKCVAEAQRQGVLRSFQRMTPEQRQARRELYAKACKDAGKHFRERWAAMTPEERKAHMEPANAAIGKTPYHEWVEHIRAARMATSKLPKTKVCVECKVEFPRGKRQAASWTRQRFCSKRCGGVWSRRRRGLKPEEREAA